MNPINPELYRDACAYLFSYNGDEYTKYCNRAKEIFACFAISAAFEQNFTLGEEDNSLGERKYEYAFQKYFKPIYRNDLENWWGYASETSFETQLARSIALLLMVEILTEKNNNEEK